MLRGEGVNVILYMCLCWYSIVQLI